VWALQKAGAGSSPCTFNGGAWLRAVAREREDQPAFIAQLEAVECFLAHQGEGRGGTSMAWSGYGGMGGDARRPIANQGRRCARMVVTPLGGWRGGREHVVHRERVRTAVRRGRPHGARTGGW
jgi:hypothetical protein